MIVSTSCWLVLACTYGLSTGALHDGESVGDTFFVESNDSAPSEPLDLLASIETELAERGLECRATLERGFSSPIFRGASFTLNCDSGGRASRSTIEALSTVREAWADSSIKPAKSLHRPVTATLDEMDLKRQTSRLLPEANPVLMSRNARDASTLNPLGVNITKLVHGSTGVARLHAEKRTGKGVRVAIVDSAFDLTAPSLAGIKVAYAKDLEHQVVGLDALAPVDGCESDLHGTANLGSIAGKGDKLLGYTGVAPDAAVEVYTVDRECGGGPTILNQVAYYTELYNNRQLDILTQPFGNTAVFQENVWHRIVNRMTENGTLVVTSCSNDGPGVFTAGGPTSDDSGLCVGSYDEPVIPSYGWLGNWTAGSESGTFRYMPGGGVNRQKYPAGTPLTVWFPWPLNESDPLPGPVAYADRDGQPRPITAPRTGQLKPPSDPNKTIILYNRLNSVVLDPADQQSLEVKYKIPYSLRYTENGPIKAFNGPRGYPGCEDPNVGCSAISDVDASKFVSLMKKHGSVQVTLTGDVSHANDALYLAEPNPKTGPDVQTYWSAWGPTLASRMGPALLGPGNFIFRPAPTRLGGYGTTRGTSYAAPYVGAVAALVKEAHPEWTAQELRANMVATAVPVNYSMGHPSYERRPYLAPVIIQGGGRVDAWAAVHTKTKVDVKSLEFNDTEHRPSSLAFKLTNSGSKAVSYTLSHQPAASAYMLNKTRYSWVSVLEEPDAVLPAYAELAISAKSVRLEAGGSTMVNVSIRAEPEAPGADKRLLSFGGYVRVVPEGSSGEETIPLTIPYHGIRGRFRSIPSLVPDDTYDIMIDLNSPSLDTVPLTENGRVFRGTSNASAPEPYNITFNDGLCPGFYAGYIVPSRDLTYSVVNTVTGQIVIQNTSIPRKSADSQEGTYGASADSKYGYDGNTDPWLPSGRYRWEVRGLRNFGSRKNPEDYDFWRSKDFVIEWTNNATASG